MHAADTHTEKMKALPAGYRRKVSAARRSDRGMVLVYTGDGKGSSSSGTQAQHGIVC